MTDRVTEYMQVHLPKCMLTYQFIEEALKTCLRTQHAIVHGKLNGVLKYNPPISSIDNAPIGRLVQYFKVFCDDKELLELLKEVQPRRNDAAHQGYLLMGNEQNDSNLIEGKIEQAKQDLEQANECLSKLHKEAIRLEKIAYDLFN